MAKPYKNSSKHPELLQFGKAVRSIRKSKKLSQEKLAELTNIDRSYMGGIERGEHNVCLININKIAETLETPISNIMTKADL
jgi:transcriptional regulator with XRE-family HTH domain